MKQVLILFFTIALLASCSKKHSSTPVPSEDTTGDIITIAGNGTEGFSGDGAKATSAELNTPSGVAIDASGNIYIADAQNQRVRKVSTTGIITTIAGNGTIGFSGDGSAATSAELNYPCAIAVDSTGNIYIADNGNNVIRKVSISGIITTIAGNGNAGFSGDGGLANAAELAAPAGVAVDNSGNLYIADYQNMRIRKVNTSGIITTIAGNGTAGYSGDGGVGTTAQLHYPLGVAVDASGNIFIADYANNAIRKLSSTGIISTIAGNGTGSYSGDGGPAISATLFEPDGVAVDTSGNLYISDGENNRIRMINASGIISTIAGNGAEGYSGDGGLATSAELYTAAVALDLSGNVYIADNGNNRIRKVNK